jgi:hypothetical protein
MRDTVETEVKSRANAGETVYYRVVPLYRGDSVVPYALQVTIVGNSGVNNGTVTIANQWFDGLDWIRTG